MRADGTSIALPDGLNEKVVLEGTYLTVHGEANRAVATQVWEAIQTSALPATGEARTAVRKIIDSLPTATRLQPVQANFTDFLKLSSIDEAKGVPEATDMVRALVEGHEAAARTARSVFPRAEKASDESTVDLLTQRLQIHEKTAWMLRSLLA